MVCVVDRLNPFDSTASCLGNLLDRVQINFVIGVDHPWERVCSGLARQWLQVLSITTFVQLQGLFTLFVVAYLLHLMVLVPAVSNHIHAAASVQMLGLIVLLTS